MKREKRTVYLMPDLAQRVDETAAVGGVSPSAIVETALDEHFTRESVYGAIEALTRRVGEIDERLEAQHASLTKLEASVAAVGRGLVVIRDMLKSSAPAEHAQPATQAREPGSSATADRPTGGLLSGWRR